jgi:hypothetical protein
MGLKIILLFISYVAEKLWSLRNVVLGHVALVG